VGEGSPVKRHEFTIKMQKFIDAPFALGDKNKGWDCLNALDEFYRSIGKDFPTEFKGINKDNYAEKFQSGIGKKLYKEFLLSLGSPINPNYALQGDLFIFDGKEWAFPGIYHGNGNLTMVFLEGARTVPLKAIKRFYGSPVGVRRL
jgi:hypothetical protein